MRGRESKTCDVRVNETVIRVNVFFWSFRNACSSALRALQNKLL